MPQLRIAIAHRPEDLPEPDASGRPPRRKSDLRGVQEALEKAGHQVSLLLVDGTRECLQRLAQAEVDLVFNMVEGFGEDNTKEPHVAAYYDLLGLRYTGSGLRGLTLAMDKALAKKVLQFHGIRTPDFATVHRGRLDWAHDIQFPVIVKPVREDGSIGIGFSALAGSIKELMERIDALHADFDHPVLIEQYIEGREITLGVLGNQSPEAFPPLELTLTHLPEGTPRIAGAEVKWAETTRAYRGSRYRLPEELPAETVEAMQAAARTAFQALQLRDYARVDFRLTAENVPYLIEVNPNPYLQSMAEFMRGARASGRTYPATILEIVSLALDRYGHRP